MTVQIDVALTGGLQCQATHAPSGDTLSTDAPQDNHGQGLHFSPTDLLATSLATCMLTTMAIAASRHQVAITGATARVFKEMNAVPQRRIGKLTVHMSLPNNIPLELRPRLEKAAHTCPVAVSLAPQTEVQLQVTYI